MGIQIFSFAEITHAQCNPRIVFGEQSCLVITTPLRLWILATCGSPHARALKRCFTLDLNQIGSKKVGGDTFQRHLAKRCVKVIVKDDIYTLDGLFAQIGYLRVDITAGQPQGSIYRVTVD